MLRKLSLALIATVSLGAAALAPTSASAWGGWHGGWHGGCYVRRLVPTPFGPRWHLVNRCY
jgi:hypothetical protein